MEWTSWHLAEMEKFSVGYCDLIVIKILQGNILTSIQNGVVSALQKILTVVLEVFRVPRSY